jgi:hypothetical protein
MTKGQALNQKLSASVGLNLLMPMDCPGDSAGKVLDRIIVLSHDAHPYGARFVALALARSLKRKCAFRLKSFFKQRQIEK